MALLAIPIVLFASITLSIYLASNMKVIISNNMKKEPIVIKRLKGEKTILLQQQKELENINQGLIDKLNAPPVQSDEVLTFFTKTLGFQNLSEKNVINLTQEKFIERPNSFLFKFNLENMQPGVTRQSGHIFVIMKSRSVMQIYPDINPGFEKNVLTYNQGETFRVARFRPSEASFPTLGLKKDIYFKVIIFTRSGDLLKSQLFGPYETQGSTDG